MSVAGQRKREGGMVLTSDSVSARKCVYITKNTQLRGGPGTPVTASDRPGSFPNCSGPCTSGPLRRTWHGTSRGGFRKEGSVGQDSEADRV